MSLTPTVTTLAVAIAIGRAAVPLITEASITLRPVCTTLLTIFCAATSVQRVDGAPPVIAPALVVPMVFHAAYVTEAVVAVEVTTRVIAFFW